jgi:hypothetical protein
LNDRDSFALGTEGTQPVPVRKLLGRLKAHGWSQRMSSVARVKAVVRCPPEGTRLATDLRTVKERDRGSFRSVGSQVRRAGSYFYGEATSNDSTALPTAVRSSEEITKGITTPVSTLARPDARDVSGSRSPKGSCCFVHLGGQSVITRGSYRENRHEETYEVPGSGSILGKNECHLPVECSRWALGLFTSRRAVRFPRVGEHHLEQGSTASNDLGGGRMHVPFSEGRRRHDPKRNLARAQLSTTT